MGIGTGSEEHTSELQSRQYLVCRLLLEKNTSEFPNSLYTTPYDHPTTPVAHSRTRGRTREACSRISWWASVRWVLSASRVFFFNKRGPPGISSFSPPLASSI